MSSLFSNLTTLAPLFHGDRSTNLFNMKPVMCISKALAMMPDPGFPMGRIICDNKIVSLSSCNYLSVLTALTSGSPQLLSQLRFLSHCRKLSTCSREHSLFSYFLGAQNQSFWRAHYLVLHTL